MWVYYYANVDRISQIAYSIDPKIILEQKQANQKKVKTKAAGEIGLSNILSKLGLKGNVGLSGDLGSESISEEKFQYSEFNQQANKVIDYFIEKDEYQFLNEHSKITDLNNSRRLIRIQGMFQPHIKGNTYSERISNYESSKSILWSGNCGEVHVIFFTGKKSLRSHTPIQPALHYINGKIYLDGFSTYASHDESSIKVTPILLGSQVGDENV